MHKNFYLALSLLSINIFYKIITCHNDDTLKNIDAFGERHRIKRLNLTGRDFNANDQKLPIALLHKMPGIKPLNFTKNSNHSSYDDLVPLLSKLINLKYLDITGCNIRDDKQKLLANKANLILIPVLAPILVLANIKKGIHHVYNPNFKKDA